MMHYKRSNPIVMQFVKLFPKVSYIQKPISKKIPLQVGSVSLLRFNVGDGFYFTFFTLT